MSKRRSIAVDGNHAVASVAHRTNEVIAIYPITPSTPMGELADEWSAHGRRNIWGSIPEVTEMQSEAGVAGAVHGALQAGALTTTFTASQGLLLMVPDLYKIAGELNAFCMHVAARTVATHALSIFGDHSDVMAARQTGCALLASASVQEAHDFACIGQAATLRARVPVIHFFDGFRTSHEIDRIEELTDDDLRAMLPDELVRAHRQRALTPDRPVVRGTAHNPDTYFQAREAVNPFYEAAPAVFAAEMERFAALTGRRYRLFDYSGHPAAERVIVLMGSAGVTAAETARFLAERGERVGVLQVRLYRPFAVDAFLGALPHSVRAIAVLDRTKEPGAPAEPLALDVIAALESRDGDARLRVIAGRYGLASKEFTPAMVRAVFEELARARPKRRFTVGIHDDVSGTSLAVDERFSIESPEVVRALFYGLGSDGTVGANKNSIKIIVEHAGLWGQGYFVYDSKKAGAMTVSHLRFGPRPIRAPYLVRDAHFVACHHAAFLERIDILEHAAEGAVFLLNTPLEPARVWGSLPAEVQEAIIGKKLRLWAIDALSVAREAGLGRRINTVMQTCFFALSGVLPREQAIARIKESIRATYARKGEELVRRNFAAVDAALDHLHEVAVPDRVTATRARPPLVPQEAPEFVRRVTAVMLAQQGDRLPVSAFPVDGTWISGTARWEKRNIAAEIPIWDPEICIQCNRCAFVCPHAAIRAKVYSPGDLSGAPAHFPSTEFRSKELVGLRYTIQVAPEDCTGCSACVAVCPARDKANPRHKAIDMLPQAQHRERERERYEFFLRIPAFDRTRVKRDAKHSQLLEPLFEYSGACAGCGETPYIKLLTQLFGDRLLIANATGCSSIYGGNLPTTPYTVDAAGRGPAWSNSLFEDNAEFGLGFRLAVDRLADQARLLLRGLASEVGETLVTELLEAPQVQESDFYAQRERVAQLRRRLVEIERDEARRLEQLADYLVRKSVWIVGGDGWAYDIGYGGLDHVLSLGRDVNVLVLDTEVYSNTGGQQSKATPLGAAAKFAAAGKETAKKDLGMMAMAYGHAYIAQLAFGADERQTVKTFLEADAYPGVSLLIAYAHCIAHGYDLSIGVEQQKRAVQSGYWPLYRFDPRRIGGPDSALTLDSRPPRLPLEEFARNETRFRMVERWDPHRYQMLMQRAAQQLQRRLHLYRHLAALHGGGADDSAEGH